MDFDTLGLFVALADAGSLSKAAERWRISQSAVSQRIRTLEAELGVTLVARGKGRPGASLTEAGACLLTAARELLARRAALETELAELAGGAPRGALRVATVYSLGLHSLTGALTRFLAECPEVALHVEYLRTDRIYDALAAGSVDCGVVACPRERPGIEVVALAEERLVLIAAPGHPLASWHVCPPSALDGQALVAFDTAIPTRQLTDEALADLGVQVRITHAFDNIETIKRVVELGQGVALVPEPTVVREVRDGTLRAIGLEGVALTRPTGALLPRGRPRGRALTRFLEALGGILEREEGASHG